MRFYTGIGSRNTPENVCSLMQSIAGAFGKAGYTGRSGSAEGADTSFEVGALLYGYPFRSYLPWEGFMDIKPSNTHVVASTLGKYKEAIQMASEIHPAWDKCSRGAKALHARNIFQVLGDDLNSPSELVVLYAEPTKTGVKGGTNTAYQLALRENIPTYNLYLEQDIDRLRDYYRNNVRGRTR